MKRIILTAVISIVFFSVFFLNAQVISPWSEKYKITGIYAPGSKGQFYTSATVTIRLKK